MDDPIYEDPYMAVTDPGPGLINVRVKKPAPVANTSLGPAEIPKHLAGICWVLKVTPNDLDKMSVDQVKGLLKEKQAKPKGK